MRLTKKERDILESVEQGEWKSVATLKEETERYRVAAREGLRKDKRVNRGPAPSRFGESATDRTPMR